MKATAPLPAMLKKAQIVFNSFIRKRDAGRGCISCGGNIDHAGHYYSAGHYTSLRFHPMNVNGQCIKCNTYLHGNLINYRRGLILKYGEAKVKQLENSAELRRVHKWHRIELEEIIKTYKNL